MIKLRVTMTTNKRKERKKAKSRRKKLLRQHQYSKGDKARDDADNIKMR
jgi:hypothetical protein